MLYTNHKTFTMKIKLTLLCICLLSTFSALQAQDSLSTQPRATAPYKLAVGARFTYGGPTGADVNLTAKYFIGRQSALEVQLPVVPQSKFQLALLSYIWQPQLLSTSRFRPYAGLGVGVMRARNPGFYPEEPDMKTNPVAVATFGVEYTFKNAPVSLSLDYRAPFMRFDNSSYQPRLPLENTRTFGIGVKYLLK